MRRPDRQPPEDPAQLGHRELALTSSEPADLRPCQQCNDAAQLQSPQRPQSPFGRSSLQAAGHDPKTAHCSPAAQDVPDASQTRQLPASPGCQGQSRPVPEQQARPWQDADLESQRSARSSLADPSNLQPLAAAAAETATADTAGADKVVCGAGDVEAGAEAALQARMLLTHLQLFSGITGDTVNDMCVRRRFLKISATQTALWSSVSRSWSPGKARSLSCCHATWAVRT